MKGECLNKLCYNSCYELMKIIFLKLTSENAHFTLIVGYKTYG